MSTQDKPKLNPRVNVVSTKEFHLFSLPNSFSLMYSFRNEKERFNGAWYDKSLLAKFSQKAQQR